MFRRDFREYRRLVDACERTTAQHDLAVDYHHVEVCAALRVHELPERVVERRERNAVEPIDGEVRLAAGRYDAELIAEAQRLRAACGPCSPGFLRAHPARRVV